MRISRDQMFMGMARLISERSTCYRLNVGALITYENNPIAMGYNGPPAGEPHCQGNDCPCKTMCTRSLHAEANAIDRIPNDLKKNKCPLILYVTHSPCFKCSHKILGTEIKRIVYEVPYRITDGLDYMSEMGIDIFQHTPSGYLINHKTSEIQTI